MKMQVSVEVKVDVAKIINALTALMVALQSTGAF